MPIPKHQVNSRLSHCRQGWLCGPSQSDISYFSFLGLYSLFHKSFLSSAPFCSLPKGDCPPQEVLNKIVSPKLFSLFLAEIKVQSFRFSLPLLFQEGICLYRKRLCDLWQWGEWSLNTWLTQWIPFDLCHGLSHLFYFYIGFSWDSWFCLAFLKASCRNLLLHSCDFNTNIIFSYSPK